MVFFSNKCLRSHGCHASATGVEHCLHGLLLKSQKRIFGNVLLHNLAQSMNSANERLLAQSGRLCYRKKTGLDRCSRVIQNRKGSKIRRKKLPRQCLSRYVIFNCEHVTVLAMNKCAHTYKSAHLHLQICSHRMAACLGRAFENSCCLLKISRGAAYRPSVQLVKAMHIMFAVQIRFVVHIAFVIQVIQVACGARHVIFFVNAFCHRPTQSARVQTVTHRLVGREQREPPVLDFVAVSTPRCEISGVE